MNLMGCEGPWNVTKLLSAIQEGFTDLIFHTQIHCHPPPPVKSLLHTVLQAIANIVLGKPNLTSAQLQTGLHACDPAHPHYCHLLSRIRPKLTTVLAVAQVQDQVLKSEGLARHKQTASKNHHIVDLDVLKGLGKLCPDTICNIAFARGFLAITVWLAVMHAQLNRLLNNLQLS